MTDKAERTVAPKQLAALIKDADQKRTRMRSISGELGERVKHAVEAGHLHKGIFALMVKLYRMDEQARDVWLRQLPLYIDICREEGLFGEEHVGDLAEMAQAGDAEADAAAAQVAENVERLEGGIRQLEEDGEEQGEERKPRRRLKPVEGGDAPGCYKMQ